MKLKVKLKGTVNIGMLFLFNFYFILGKSENVVWQQFIILVRLFVWNVFSLFFLHFFVVIVVVVVPLFVCVIDSFMHSFMYSSINSFLRSLVLSFFLFLVLVCVRACARMCVCMCVHVCDGEGVAVVACVFVCFDMFAVLYFSFRHQFPGSKMGMLCLPFGVTLHGGGGVSE